MAVDDLKDQIRKLRLTAKRLIHQFGEGSFRTTFLGRGIEFAGLREYVPGDDIRRIDWNTTARRGTPYVKTFTEEHDLSVLLAVDLSSSMDAKSQAFVRIVSLLAYLAESNEDRLGCLGFTDRIEFFLPPRKRFGRSEEILHKILSLRKGPRKTSLQQAFQYLKGVLKKQVILFVLSDFFDLHFESSFLALARKHEMVGIYLYSPLEIRLPKNTVFQGLDPESGKSFLLDACDSTIRTTYESVFQQHRKRVAGLFLGTHSDLLALPADSHADLRLIRFLQQRQISRGPLQVIQE